MIHPSYVIRYTDTLQPNEGRGDRKLSFYAQACNHLMHSHCYTVFRQTLKDKVHFYETNGDSMRIQLHFTQKRNLSSSVLCANNWGIFFILLYGGIL
jgi:hypothetical protein